MNDDAPLDADPAAPLASVDGVDRTTLIRAHHGLVRGVALRLKRRLQGAVDVDELIADGMIGLVEAAQRFEPSRGVSFVTFAYPRIEGSMQDGLRRMSWWGRAASRGEAPGSQAPLPLERGGDELPDPEPPIEGRVIAGQLRARMAAALVRLPERDRWLLVRHYYQGCSLERLGAQLGVSRSWASRLHGRSVARLGRLMASGPVEPGPVEPRLVDAPSVDAPSVEPRSVEASSVDAPPVEPPPVEPPPVNAPLVGAPMGAGGPPGRWA